MKNQNNLTTMKKKEKWKIEKPNMKHCTNEPAEQLDKISNN